MTKAVSNRRSCFITIRVKKQSGCITLTSKLPLKHNFWLWLFKLRHYQLGKSVQIKVKWNDLCYVPWTSQIVKLDLSKRSFHDVLNEWQWIFQFHQVQNKNCSQAFFSLGFIWREKKLKFDLWFLHLPPFGLTCCNCNPTLSAHHHIFVAILCMYVWGQIIS